MTKLHSSTCAGTHAHVCNHAPIHTCTHTQRIKCYTLYREVYRSQICTNCCLGLIYINNVYAYISMYIYIWRSLTICIKTYANLYHLTHFSSSTSYKSVTHEYKHTTAKYCHLDYTHMQGTVLILCNITLEPFTRPSPISRRDQVASVLCQTNTGIYTLPGHTSSGLSSSFKNSGRMSRLHR